ncbi:cytochrome c oxidase assembly protein [Paenibacillus xylaniclasticus]|uniref:cytochrome c oxidase assembly protein n=1 Tax=Paenibacillus xylaniclasticus TaxID=588083 RepID=UPI000FD7630A|nr:MULTISPECIES: cytochrome c oxidase assembly protein [Paenibacillus]
MRLIAIIFFFVLTILYLSAAAVSNRRFRKWPSHRSIAWSAGIGCIALTMVWSLSGGEHTSFINHMSIHLLLGMFAPLLIAISAPITLIARSLPIPWARTIIRIIRYSYIHSFMHPVTSALLNVGGMWALYVTDLYKLMHHSSVIYTMVHIHLFAAGYLFVCSILYFEPTVRRFSYRYRAIVLVLASAGHSILSKYLCHSPPNGVPIEQAEAGAMLMYYGGDLIEIFIVMILCCQWYTTRLVPKASRL